MIDSYRSYVPFWLRGVVGAELRPDSYFHSGGRIVRHGR